MGENLVNVDYHIVDYCNINCVSCGHLCPLVNNGEGEVLVSQVVDELRLLRDKSEDGSRIDMLTITGGECTLHPNFEDIVRIADSLFPGKVRIFSNGTSLNKLFEIKDLIDSRKVRVTLSDYRFNLNQDKIKELGTGIIVDEIPRNNNIWNRQFFSKSKINTIGEYYSCEARGYCTQYKDGKLYLCQYSAYYKYFDRAFKGQHNLSVYGNDGLDLKNVKDFDEVIEFRNQHVSPLCYHCMDCMPNRPHQQWGRSNKQLDEWYNGEL